MKVFYNPMRPRKYAMTREQLRDLARKHGVQRGRNTADTVTNLRKAGITLPIEDSPQAGDWREISRRQAPVDIWKIHNWPNPNQWRGQCPKCGRAYSGPKQSEHCYSCEKRTTTNSTNS